MPASLYAECACGAELPPKKLPWHFTRKYCSERCKRRARFARKKKHPNRTIPCERCGSVFLAKQPHIRFCSTVCLRAASRQERRDARAAAREALPRRLCQRCRAPIPVGPWQAQRLYCSKSCQIIAANRRRHPGREFTCAQCGSIVSTVSQKRRFCSTICRLDFYHGRKVGKGYNTHGHPPLAPPDIGCGGPCTSSLECPYPACIWDGHRPPELLSLDHRNMTAVFAAERRS